MSLVIGVPIEFPPFVKLTYCFLAQSKIIIIFLRVKYILQIFREIPETAQDCPNRAF